MLIDPTSAPTSTPLALNRYFQQRHLLAHSQGVVDDDHIRKSRDAARKPGRRTRFPE